MLFVFYLLTEILYACGIESPAYSADHLLDVRTTGGNDTLAAELIMIIIMNFFNSFI